MAELIRTLIRPGFGLPEKPGSPDHIEGLVGEYLWWVIVSEFDHGWHVVVPSDGPSFLPTEPGGDGLLIHRHPSGELAFRLWELKKHSTKSSPKAAVKRACEQLNDKAIEYLAKYAADATDRGVADAELKRLYASMAMEWIGRGQSATVGVGVATDQDPHGCFSDVHTHFDPAFHRPGGLEALATLLRDLPAFAIEVRDEMWTPLT
jgi:hypothetical protein